MSHRTASVTEHCEAQNTMNVPWQQTTAYGENGDQTAANNPTSHTYTTRQCGTVLMTCSLHGPCTALVLQVRLAGQHAKACTAAASPRTASFAVPIMSCVTTQTIHWPCVGSAGCPATAD